MTSSAVSLHYPSHTMHFCAWIFRYATLLGTATSRIQYRLSYEYSMRQLGILYTLMLLFKDC